MINPEDQEKMLKRVNWPVGGYAPGNYYCKCTSCHVEFIGDKRAMTCLACAINYVAGQASLKAGIAAAKEAATKAGVELDPRIAKAIKDEVDRAVQDGKLTS